MMNLRLTFGSLFGAAALSVLACSDPNAPIDLSVLGKKLCEPRALVECICANRENGLKRCNESGSGFEECRISDTQGCNDVVETDAGSSGNVPRSTCGNGKVEEGEACDDGNTNDSDFCNSLCLPKGDPAGAGKCPGMAVHLWGTEVVEASANTSMYEHLHSAEEPCNGTSMGLFGNDRVFAVTAHKAGQLNVEANAASFDVVLFVNAVCADSKTEVACANKTTGLSTEPERLPQKDKPIVMTKGQTLYVIVDGGAISSIGAAQIRFWLQ
jgi:cysteine-rich repeat protein